jgi:hypothetical protein
VLWEFIVGGVDSGAPSLQTFSLNLFLSETACEGARAHHVKSFADDSAKVLAKKLVNGDVAIVTGSRGVKLKRFIMGCDPINFELKLKDKNKVNANEKLGDFIIFCHNCRLCSRGWL